jgi:hypothetical protein
MAKQTDVNEFARRAQEAIAQAQRSLNELLAAQAMRARREAELRAFIFEQIAKTQRQPVPGAMPTIVDAPTRFARRVRRRRNLV